MTDTTTTLHRNSRDSAWPEFAPVWARQATFEGWPRQTVTFSSTWTVPSLYRDADDLDFVKVEQVWAAAAGGAHAPENAPRVVVGMGEMWVDHRSQEVAATLRQIAEALDPLPDAPAGGA